MRSEAASAVSIFAGEGIAVPRSAYATHFPMSLLKSSVPQRESLRDISMGITHGPYAGLNRGEHSANKHIQQTTTPEVSDWLADLLSNQSAKEISRKTGQGQRAAESVKMGRNGLTMAHLVNMCRADPAFRAEFFRFCGGTLEGDPEMVAALSKAINAIVRRQP